VGSNRNLNRKIQRLSKASNKASTDYKEEKAG
jgi:hypothetical protein